MLKIFKINIKFGSNNMKSIYKLLIDIGPLSSIFYILYKKWTTSINITSYDSNCNCCFISYILEKKIPIMPTVGAGIVLIFGGLTIYFDNEVFFKMKPTIINVLFAVILYGGILIKKPLLKYYLEQHLNLKKKGGEY